MSNLQPEFIDICIKNNILQFGEFKLKSGRISPYFFNAGLFNNGELLGHLARYYAELISRNLDSGFMLYGPAYKGIPLVAAIAVQLFQFQDQNVAYAFNRKESKDHGEGGLIVGADLQGKVVIVDDVITAGTSIHESVKIIESAGAQPAAIAIALDRQEIADGETRSAVQKIQDQYQIPVLSLLRLDSLVSYLQSTTGYQKHYDAITSYRDKYGSS
jgi:orotate phosphoribosyltransferase